MRQIFSLFALSILSASLLFCDASLPDLKTTFENSPSTESATALSAYYKAAKKSDEGLYYFTRIQDEPDSTPEQRAYAVYGEGIVHFSRHDWSAAGKAINQSRTLHLENKDIAGESDALNRLGVVLRMQGDNEQALKHWKHSLDLRKSLGDKPRIASSLLNVGNGHWAVGEYFKARDFYRESLALREETGDMKGKSGALNNLGALQMLLGEYDDALALLNESLALKKSLGNHKAIPSTLNNLGEVMRRLSRFDEAREFYSESLKLKLADGDLASAVTTLNNLGVTAQSVGDYPLALDYYQKTMDLLEKTKDKESIADAYNNIGAVYYYMGDYERAFPFLQKSMEIREALDNRRGMASSYQNMGTFYNMFGNDRKSNEYFQKSLRLRQVIGDPVAIVATLTNIGHLHKNEARYAKSLKYYRKALVISQSAGLKDEEAFVRVGVSETFVLKGNPREGLEAGLQALELAQNLDTPRLHYKIHRTLGLAYAAMGEMENAASHLKRALENIETLRAVLSNSDQRAKFLRSQISTYEHLVRVLLQKHSLYSDALKVSEKMKARTFLEQMGRARHLKEGISPDLLARKQSLESRLTWLEQKTEL